MGGAKFMSRKKPNLDRLYKETYMLCLYDEDDMLRYEFDNPIEMSKALGMKKEHIYATLTRFMKEPETHNKICGYKLEFVALN